LFSECGSAFEFRVAAKRNETKRETKAAGKKKKKKEEIELKIINRKKYEKNRKN